MSKVFTGLIILAIAANAYAESKPTIIFDNDRAVPAIQYSVGLFDPNEDVPNSPPAAMKVVSFPIKTTELTPGSLKPILLKKPNWITHAIFLIGIDKASIHWLKKNKEYLQSIGAVGVLVNVDNYDQLLTLRKLSGLKIAAGNADGFAKSLGIEHYPALISLDGKVSQ